MEQQRFGALLREAREEYRQIAESIVERNDTESRLRSMIASRFEIVDRLGKSYYERENTASGQAAMARQVKQLIDGFAENGEMLAELEQMVDEAHDGAMQKLRADFPRMKEADARLLCYIFGGFSPQVISLFMEESVANIYARLGFAPQGALYGPFGAAVRRVLDSRAENSRKTLIYSTDF